MGKFTIPEIVVVLAIIGLIVWKVVSSAKADKTTTLPMKWFYFYTYFRLPIGAILLFASTSRWIEKGQEAFLLVLGIIVLIVATCIGLHRRKLWGWYLNWVLLAVDTLSFPLVEASRIQHKSAVIFAICLVVIGLGYTLPNVIYFRKREVLFT